MFFNGKQESKISFRKWLNALEEKETQQKEFKKYLEDKIKKEKEDLEQVCKIYKISKENNGAYDFAYSYISNIKEILQKYKLIIGDDKNGTN